MTEQDYERLSSYMDGELSPSEARDLEQRLEREGALRRALTQLEAVDSALTAGFSTASATRVPPHVRQLLEHAEPALIQRRAPARWGLALAASIAAAAAVVWLPQDQAAYQDASAFDPTASDEHLQALENLPSRQSGWNDLADGTRLRPLLSYPTRDGTWCREYRIQANSQDWRGVACREDGRWISRVIAPQPLEDQSGYRTAGAEDAAAIAEFNAEHAADIALGAGEEADVIARGWR